MNFATAIDRVLSHEGGYVNNPADPGGETQWGISKRSYPNIDIRALTREQAKEIYFEDFWQPVIINKVPDSVVYQVTDAAVNHGMGNAIRMLQRAAGVADDGDLGRVSVQAIKDMPENDLLMRFLAERLEFMTKLKAFDSFGRGWSKRIAHNLRYAAEDNI